MILTVTERRMSLIWITTAMGSTMQSIPFQWTPQNPWIPIVMVLAILPTMTMTMMAFLIKRMPFLKTPTNPWIPMTMVWAMRLMPFLLMRWSHLIQIKMVWAITSILMMMGMVSLTPKMIFPSMPVRLLILMGMGLTTLWMPFHWIQLSMRMKTVTVSVTTLMTITMGCPMR